MIVYKTQSLEGLTGPEIAERVIGEGLSLVADYETMAAFKGPPPTAKQLLTSLQDQGLDAEIPSDLDSFSYHDHTIDADLGPTPRGPEDAQLYFLTLQSYATEEWFKDLEAQGVRIVQPLGPVAWVVRAPRAIATGLGKSRPWIRGLFAVPSELKASGMEATVAEPGPFRDVVVQVAEESEDESLAPLLDSMASTPAVEVDREIGKATYQASLSDLDIQTLTRIDRVWEIAPVGHPVLSSERPAQLVGQPGSVTNGESTLPATNPSGNTYLQWLASKGLGITANTFSNTIVGVIDTGFDNGIITPSGIHPDFRYTYGSQQYAIVASQTTDWPFKDDRDYHGTITASIIAGYPASNRTDGAGYLFGLGVAPTVRLEVEKYFNCTVTENTVPFTGVLDRVAGAGANVINMSFNDPSSGCRYTSGESGQVDIRTRTKSVLFTAAAGNSPEGCVPNVVRAPATAKNCLAMGSTDNYSLNWPNNSTANTCAWDSFPSPQDARRIPSYSAIWDQAGPVKSLVKPDLVAPSTRVTGPLSRSGTSCGSSILCNASVASFPTDGVTYGMSAGTSFAAPAAAGAAAVVRKWYRNNKGVDPSPAMTKALLINGARDIGSAPDTPPCIGTAVRDQSFAQVACVGYIPDPYQGWGMLSLERLLGTWSNYYVYDQGTFFSTSGSVWQSPTLTVRNLAKPVNVTLVWTDPAGADSPHYIALNDLNLNVFAGPNTTLNWQGNYFSNGTTYPRPPGVLFRDSFNNVERVVIPANALNPTHNTVSIKVTAYAITQPNQDFAIAVENAGL